MGDKWTLEQVIIATEVVAYIASVEQDTKERISLEEAYDDKSVSEDMRLTKFEIEQIISDILLD